MTWRQTLGSLGRLDACLYVINAALQRISPRFALTSYRVVAQPVAAGPFYPAGRTSAITIRRAPPGDPALTKSVARPPGEIRQRFDSDGICLLAEKRGEVVGYLWLLFGAYPEPEDRCLIVPWPPGRVAWDLDVFIMPNERLGPAFTRLWDAANALLRERGIDWTLSRISTYNVPSLAAHRHLGSLPLGRMSFLRLPGVELFVGTMKPYVKLSLGGAQGPRILVSAPASPARPAVAA